MKDIEQSSGDYSQTINSGNDTNIIIQNNIDYEQLRYTVVGILWDTFPRLRDEAMQTAKVEVENFARDLIESIAERKINNIEEKLKIPDIQLAINEVLSATAKKNDKADKDTLKKLVISKIETDSNEEDDLIIDDAITISTKLSKNQIEFLGFIYYLTGLHLTFRQNISEVESIKIDPSRKDEKLTLIDSCYSMGGISIPERVVKESYTEVYSAAIERIFNAQKYTYQNINYLISKGCIMPPMFEDNNYEKIIYKRTGISLSNEEGKIKFTRLIKIAKEYGFEDINDINSIKLTPTGNLIALAYLSRHMKIKGF